MQDLELWGGHECTVNRLGASFMDQTILSGHQDRLSDLDLFADLGLKALRYPVLWERTAPARPQEYDWRWSDERLGRLRELMVARTSALLSFVVLTACSSTTTVTGAPSDAGAPADEAAAPAGPFTLTSTAFAEGETIPSVIGRLKARIG